MLLSENADIILALVVNYDSHSYAFDSFEDGIDYWYKLFDTACGGTQYDKNCSSQYLFNGTFLRIDGCIAYREDSTAEEENRLQFLYSSQDANVAIWEDFLPSDIDSVTFTRDEIIFIRDILHGLRDL